MKSGIDASKLNALDAAVRLAYIQELVQECQRRVRDIAPDLRAIISAYGRESEIKGKEALLLLILQAGRSDEVREFCLTERSESNPFIRERCIWYFARYYPQDGQSLYRDHAQDPDHKIRYWIATMIEDLDRAAAIDLYLSAWSDPEAPPDLREGIENDLALIGDEETIPLLRRLAKCVGGENLLSVIWRIERRLAVQYLEPMTKPFQKYFVNSIACEQCHRTVTVDSRYMGAKARCRECGHEFKVPHW